jgi:hypothetical protein
MSDVDNRSPELAYATKPNIVLPPEQFPTAAHITALTARATARANDGFNRSTVTAVATPKKG